MTQTLQTALNKGNPTDLPMRLGQLNIGDQLEAYAASGIDTANRTVTADVCLLVDGSGEPEYGHVLTVHATAGGSAGPKAIILTGTPSAGQVLLQDAGNGQPRLTFAAADTVSACRVQMLKTKVARNGQPLRAALAQEVG